MTIAIEDNVLTPLRASGAARASIGNSNDVREALAPFADEESALRYLEDILWPGGVRCPDCGQLGKVGKLNGASTRAGTCKCYNCRKIFSVLHGTLMSGSHVPAHKWLQAMHLTDGGTQPIRVHHLSLILNVSFRTAARMIRRLASAAAKMDRRPLAPSGVANATSNSFR
jgi:transposase-like protein